MKPTHTTTPTHPASWIWLVISAVVILIVAFGHFPEQADWHWLLPLNGNWHIPMMAAGTAAVLLTAYVCLRSDGSGMVRKRRLLTITGALTALQIILVYNYYLFTDWDVQQLTGLGEAMAKGEPADDFTGYFRWAPNNLLLARIFALVFYITGPLWGLDTSLFPLVALQCVGAGLTTLMLFQTAMHIWYNKRCAVVAYLFYALLVWLSPWWSIPYSDIWGLMFAVTLLWMATALPFRRQWLRFGLLGALTALGYYIKPQIVLVSLSLILVRLFETICNKANINTLLKPTGFALGGIAMGVLVAHLAVAGCGLHLHTSKGLGAPHYLMMGANYQSIGIYSAIDVDFSRSYTNKHERRRAELDMTRQRYAALGFKGTMTLWGRKNLLNFSDGTFYWGREGAFYKYVPERSDPLARATRSVYYNRSYSGRWNEPWSVATTSLWFGLLIMSFVAAWPKRKKHENRDEETHTLQVVMLAVAMLTLFHTLFEARARYLFCFTPLFVLLATEGARRTVGLVRKHTSKVSV